MKRLFTLIIGFILCLDLFGQTDTAFQLTYGGIQDDICNQIKGTYDGGYIMIGTSNSFGCGNTDFYAVKIDSLGRHQWSKTYGGTENEEGFSVTPTSDHGYAFVGFTDSYGAGGYDVFLVKTDSAGNQQWQKTYGGADWDFGYSIQQLPDSGFIICGQTYSYGPSNGNIFVVRTDKKGDTLWTRVLGGMNYNIANSICVEEDSLYALIGATTNPGFGDTNVCFILMDDKGIVKKDTTYGISAISNIGNSIRETLDHGFVVFGNTDTSHIVVGKPDEMMIKVDSIGQVQWIQVYASPDVGIGKDALQEPDGKYVSLGTNNSYGYGGYGMHIQYLSPGGYFINGLVAGGIGDEQGNSIAVGKNGNVMFAGSSDSPGFTEGLYDIMTARWDKADSISNIRYNYIKNFYDTCLCTLGISNQEIIHPEVKVFPNPISSSATILVQGDIGSHYTLNVQNILGESISYGIPMQSISHGQSICHIEKSNLATGVYLYTIINQTGITVATGKFLVE